MTLLVATLILAGGSVWSPIPAEAQNCPSGPLSTAKSGALYVLMPTAVDGTFPDYSVFGADTSPLNPFTMANHDASLSTSQVRQRVLQLMEAGYCEFDVEVKLTTTKPVPTEARWQIVGVGSDDSNAGGLVGEAQAVDSGDGDAQDYSRVWVESLETFTGTSLTGANSTLERWATAIANLAAHESAHNYGGSHPEAAPRPGEDGAANHFIADPAQGATAASVSDSFNHFGDTTYERFAHDIGLNVKTLHNWDFVNPNSSNADRLVVTLLSSASSLTLGWFYTGSLSPWTSPTVTKRPGTLTFRGTAYSVFDLEFSTAKTWSDGAAGVAPAGIKFHVGASFTETDPVIVYEATVSNGGSDLPLHPRMFGYDAGTNSPEFAVRFYNPRAAEAGELELSDLRVLFLPRMLDLEQMVEGGRLESPSGLDVVPFERRPAPRDERESTEERPVIRNQLQGPVTIGDAPFVFPIATLTDLRHLDETFVADPKCVPGREQGQVPAFGVPGAHYCPGSGTALSLFPATYTYVVATVTEPNAHYWDPALGRFVDGPLDTRVFFQVGGLLPDFNDNGEDDLLDIRSGTSADRNDNGIPDEAEKGNWAISAHLGATIPEGVASRVLGTGFDADLGLEYELSPNWSLLAVLGFDQLADDGLGTDLELWHLTLEGRYYFNVSAALKTFVLGGAGAYELNPGDTEFGATLGLGLRWDFSSARSLEAIYRRHEVQLPGSTDLEYAAAQIGLRWKL